MQNNYYKYYNIQQNPKNPREDDIYQSGYMRDIKKKSYDDLVIDDNSVYEIDQDCFERAKKARLGQKQDWYKR